MAVQPMIEQRRSFQERRQVSNSGLQPSGFRLIVGRNPHADKTVFVITGSWPEPRSQGFQEAIMLLAFHGGRSGCWSAWRGAAASVAVLAIVMLAAGAAAQTWPGTA